jgi:hypothetical protein
MSVVLEPRVIEARLCYDSAGDPSGGTRGFGRQPRMLLFKWDSLTVDLMLCDRGTEVLALHGQVTDNPAGRPVVGASAEAGDTRAETDEEGQFVVWLENDWNPRRVSIRTQDLLVLCSIPD